MMPSALSELKVWSFFSGAMGLDLGLEQAGLKVVLACDVDPNCRATIAANRPQLPVLSDVWRYDAARAYPKAGPHRRDGWRAPVTSLFHRGRAQGLC